MKSVITYREHDFKEAKQLHCRKLIAFTDQFALKKNPNKDKTPHFLDSLFVFVSRAAWVISHACRTNEESES